MRALVQHGYADSSTHEGVLRTLIWEFRSKLTNKQRMRVRRAQRRVTNCRLNKSVAYRRADVVCSSVCHRVVCVQPLREDAPDPNMLNLFMSLKVEIDLAAKRILQQRIEV